MADWPFLEDAWLLLDQESGLIAEIGQGEQPKGEQIAHFDAQQGFILPGFVDSHTHMVYAAPRQKEFEMRLNGATYQEIAEAGGGILNSAKHMAECSEEQLFNDAKARLFEAAKLGTVAFEIKSGYGLSRETEEKMLRVISRLKRETPFAIKATYLGAHAVPERLKANPEVYVDEVCQATEWALPYIDFVDVFCEKGYFSPEQTVRILSAFAAKGVEGKVHAHQLTSSGGVLAGVACKSRSVDHLEFFGEEELGLMRASRTIPTLLPSAAFFLQLDYPPARFMIDNGLGPALATDCNPGSSPSASMPFALSLACIQMKMSVNEAFNSATINGAYAAGLESSHGKIAIGAEASLMVTKPISSIAYLPYSFSENVAFKTFVKGKPLNFEG